MLQEETCGTKIANLEVQKNQGDMIEVYKLLTNKYDDDTVRLDVNTDTRTRAHTKKLVVKRCHYDVRKYSFCIRVVNIWNSLPNSVITATSVNSFKNRLDTFWADQDVLYNYNYKANITGNRDIML